MFHNSTIRREAVKTARNAHIQKLIRNAQIERLERQYADMIRSDRERTDSDDRLVSNWQARFNTARNATCESQKNFRGI